MAGKQVKKTPVPVRKDQAKPKQADAANAVVADIPVNGADARTIELDLLDLDEKNPRFGRQAGHVGTQVNALDYIVESFGVDNLLSSLAINGFFDAEPLIARPTDNGRFVVVEGNRRLAACLILAGDKRAKNQGSRTSTWKGRTKTQWTGQTKVPVRIFSNAEADDSLLPYLGVRHLVASQPWDSFAKAKWIADVVESGKMTLDEIVAVIGDKNNTIERLLEGYYFVNQVTESGQYDTKESVRRGRGSNPDYPFSWVYTLLDNSGVREWLGMGERKDAGKEVLAADRVADGASTLRYLLGDKKQGRNPAITDSREIGLLGSALGDPEKRSLLRNGRSAREIDVLSKRADDLLADYLNQALSALVDADQLLSTGRMTSEEALKQVSKVKQIKNVVDGLIAKLI